MKNKKYNLLILLFRLTIVAIAVTGIFAKTPNGFWGQFWFFTLQTNLFVTIMMITLIFNQILNFFNIKTTFTKSTWFFYLRILVTFFISITGLIFCFILTPVAIVTNNLISVTLSYRDIFLHIFVPILTIIEFFVLAPKIKIKQTSSYLFLIYPLIYTLTIFLRATFNGSTFPGGSIYPYFFLDPTFYNQGWTTVFCYSIILLVSFHLLSMLFIYFNNKLISANKKDS